MKGSDRREWSFDTAESETLGMCGNSMRENRETLQTPTLDGGVGRSEKAKGRKVDMHVCGESDDLIVPTKRANKARGCVGGGVRRGKGVDQGERTARTRAGHRAGDASHRGCGAYDKPYPRTAGRHMNPR